MLRFSVSILIATHNRADILRRTLCSLAAVSVPQNVDAEVVVVANGCTDATQSVVVEIAAQMPFPARCVAEPQLGLSFARNRAVREARAESQVMAFLDDDVSLSQEWLAGLKEIFESTAADVVAGKVTLWWEVVSRPDWLTPAMEGSLSRLDLGEQVIEVKHGVTLVGANFAFRRKVVETVGLFATGLGRIGNQVLACEETEFAERALNAGFHMFYSPKMHVQHWVAPHRATHEYIEKIARGFGQSMIFMRRSLGPVEVIKQTAGRLSLLAWYTMAQWITPLTGKNRFQYRTYCAYNAGALAAVFSRLTSKSGNTAIHEQPIARLEASTASR